MTPALAQLDALGVLAALRPKAAPLKVMRIVDATKRLIRSPVVTFRAAEIGEDHFGLNMPNRDLNAALEAAVADPARHRLEATNWSTAGRSAPTRSSARLADGTSVEGALAVAADGRLSPAREAAGIRTSTRSYPQAALVLNFAHSRGHGFVSTEFHTETGPFTQVPLPGNRSSLVWVVKPKTAEELAGARRCVAFDAGRGADAVDARARLGRARPAGLPASARRCRYALPRTAWRWSARPRMCFRRSARRGSTSASGMSAISLQSLRKIAPIRAPRQLWRPMTASAARTCWRAPARSICLNLSLLSDMLPAQLARSAGLGVVGGFAPIRALFMREGLQPGSGFAKSFSDLREQIRR